MKTDDLIALLAMDAEPVPAGAARNKLVVHAAIGALVVLIVLALWFGFNPRLPEMMGTSAYWMKTIYTGALTAAAFAMAIALSRPGASSKRGVTAFLAVLALMVCLGIAQLVSTPADQQRAVWLGGSWTLCPWRILALSVPTYIALVLAMRRLAPTRLRLAGGAAGVLSGALGATIYGLFCRETSATFVATWYTMGILASGAIGALLGTRLLRWR
jgi:hypothetical protein